MEVHFQCTIQICRYQCPDQCADAGAAAPGPAYASQRIGTEAQPRKANLDRVRRDVHEAERVQDVGMNRIIQVSSCSLSLDPLRPAVTMNWGLGYVPGGVDGRPDVRAGTDQGQHDDDRLPVAQRNGGPHLHDVARLRRHAGRPAGHPRHLVPAVGLFVPAPPRLRHRPVAPVARLGLRQSGLCPQKRTFLNTQTHTDTLNRHTDTQTQHRTQSTR